MVKFYIKLMLTSLIVFCYSITWIALEAIIYHSIAFRLVDDIMMLLFIPIIWLASDKIYRNLCKEV